VDWKRNGEQCPVGQFQIDRIAANGDIHAGCHFIKWNEIEATARALGMLHYETQTATNPA
jgi:hypothetical protein